MSSSSDDSSSSSSSWMEKNQKFQRYDTTTTTTPPTPPSSSSKTVADYNEDYDTASKKREKQKRRRRKTSGVAYNDRVESENKEFRRRKDESFRDNFRGTRVFVQGLPDWVGWQELKDHFKKAGDVVFASVSIDTQTGQSKNCGVVQYETTDMARNAIKTMRDLPLDGNILYDRPDYQEDAPNPATTTNNNNRPASTPSHPRSSDERRTLASTWHCADEDNASHLPPSEYAQITTLIQSRDKARRSRDYDTSDAIRNDLKQTHKVHLDDRLKTWWYSVDDVVPQSVRDVKGEGKWGKRAEPAPWRQIPTTTEND